MDPECSEQDKTEEQGHPIAEFLPNIALLALLISSVIFGYNLATHPATDDKARPLIAV